MRRMGILAAAWLVPALLCGQWFNVRTPGIPRTSDQKANLTAPAPRMADGKPDLSGLWRPQFNPYYLDVIQNLKEEQIFRPTAEAVFKKHLAEFHRSDPVTHCLPGGPIEILAGGGIAQYRILQTHDMMGLLYERGTVYREIFLDGRALPKDPNPTWMGYSVGHWDGDTLVVESVGFNDRTWLDRVGHPHSEELRVIERFRRVDFGHMQLQVTYDDPQTLIRPLSISVAVNYSPDTEMLETICENEKDTSHLVGNSDTDVKVDPALLAKYAGAYQLRGGPPVIAGFFGTTQTITEIDGQLWMNALPLIPRSATTFESVAAPVQFFMDARGAVTHLMLRANEGEARYDRTP